LAFLTGEGCSLELIIEVVGSAEDTARGERLTMPVGLDEGLDEGKFKGVNF
jgi:hypothetical protein